MSISSIFTDIKITDSESAEKFVEGLEAASKIPPRVPTTDVKPQLRDKQKIRELVENRVNNLN